MCLLTSVAEGLFGFQPDPKVGGKFMPLLTAGTGELEEGLHAALQTIGGARLEPCAVRSCMCFGQDGDAANLVQVTHPAIPLVVTLQTLDWIPLY